MKTCYSKENFYKTIENLTLYLQFRRPSHQNMTASYHYSVGLTMLTFFKLCRDSPCCSYLSALDDELERPNGSTDRKHLYTMKQPQQQRHSRNITTLQQATIRLFFIKLNKGEKKNKGNGIINDRTAQQKNLSSKANTEIL